MTKRLVTLCLILSLLFLLCACPGGEPTLPPEGGDDPCATCGKDPCECPEEKPGDGTERPSDGVTVTPEDADTSLLYGEGGTLRGAGDSLPEDAAALIARPYDEATATDKAFSDLFGREALGGGVIRVSGTAALKNAQNKSYAGEESLVLLFPEGLTLSNCTSLSLKNAVIVGDVSIPNCSDILFENVQFKGKLTLGNRTENVVLDGCRLSALESEADGVTVVDSYVGFSGAGITSTGEGLYVRNCRLEGTGTGISATGKETEIRGVSVKTDRDGICVEMRGEEVVNSIVTLSTLRGAQRSVVIGSAFNTVVVRNSLISVHVSGGKNVYVCDNEMGGRLFGENNNYFLADNNIYPADGLDHRAVMAGCENVNGDTLTDVNARLEVGANEALLPHVNKDQFLTMERRATVKEYGVAKESPVYEYMVNRAKTQDCVVIAPGAYEVDVTASFTTIHSGTAIYAYGVLAEAVMAPSGNYYKGHIKAVGVSDLTFKGLAIGYAQPGCGQVYILEKLGENRVTVASGAGFWNEFALTGSTVLRNTSDVHLIRAGTDYTIGNGFLQSTAKNTDGTMTVTLTSETYDIVNVGDIMVCRAYAYSHVIKTEQCEDVLLQDFTMYGYAGGYGSFEEYNINGVTYHRTIFTAKPGMLIDKDTYNQHKEWQQTYGVDLGVSRERIGGEYVYRGPAALISTLDSTHSSFSGTGSQAISCIFENMDDDCSNQNARHARLSEIVDNGDGTLTVVYKGNLTARVFGSQGANATYDSYCAPFRQGDSVYIYTSGGQLVCDGEALADGYQYDTVNCTYTEVKAQKITRYAVKVKAEDVNKEALAGFDLTDDSHRLDEKVLVDNNSRGSGYALFENTLFRNGPTNGVRMKSPNSTIINCTFRNLAKNAILANLDPYWGESGTVTNLVFERNLIDHVSFAVYGAPKITDTSEEYKFTPICIMGLGGSSADPDHLLFRDIRIEGNKFINRSLDLYNYAIYLRACANVSVKNNDFGTSEEEDGLEKVCGVLYLNGAAGIELSGNTYSPYILGDPAAYVHGTVYRDIFGTDVSEDGVSKIKDNL